MNKFYIIQLLRFKPSG
jgi:poly [ADP-ribose] polymerase